MEHRDVTPPDPVGPPVPYVPGSPEHAFRITDVTGHGYDATASMGTGAWVLGADGAPTHAALGVLLDQLLGVTAVSHKPAAHWGVTIDLYATFCAPLPSDGTPLFGRATTAHHDDAAAVATGTVLDATGRTVAVAAQRIRFVSGDPLPPVAEPSGGIRDDGRDLLGTLGARGTVEADGEAEVVLEAGPTLLNPGGALHGGVQFALAAEATAMAVAPLRLASLHLAYVRPGPVTGTVRVRTATTYRGRTAAVVGLQVLRADGKPCAIGTATCTAR